MRVHLHDAAGNIHDLEREEGAAARLFESVKITV